MTKIKFNTNSFIWDKNFIADFTYFEVEILRKASTTESEGHGIGLVSGNCEAFVYPGWTTNSIGYHNDDGGLYVNGDKVTGNDCSDMVCTQ